LSGFITWITTYGSIIGFFVQMFYYIVIAIAAIWAATTFARYVKFMVGDETLVEIEEDAEDEDAEDEDAEDEEGEDVDVAEEEAEDTGSDDDEPSVEEFVE
jgi:hypothetical protein